MSGPGFNEARRLSFKSLMPGYSCGGRRHFGTQQKCHHCRAWAFRLARIAITVVERMAHAARVPVASLY